MSEIQCWLQHLDGSALVLPPSGALLGQAAGCVFRLFDGRIAEEHARIEVRDGSAFLGPRDRAPCALNGERLLHPRVLRDGDWISLAPGQVFRVHIRPCEPPRWLVQLGGERFWISPGDEDVEGGRLRLSPEGDLLLRLWQPARRGEQVLLADGRAWALAVGDVVQLSDGQELTVLQGKALQAPTAAPLAPGGWLRYRPPERVQLSAGGRLALHYREEVLSVLLEDSTALAHALLSAPGEKVSLEPLGGRRGLLRLQERLIAAGVDGFSLIRQGDGSASLPVPAQRIELDAVLSSTVTPSGPRWWLCSDDGSRWLVDSAGVLLGRHEECELRSRIPYVHRHHAVLQAACEALWLTPLGRHPVYLGGAPVHRPRRLQAGTELRIVPEARLWIEQHTVEERAVPAYSVRLSDGTVRTIRQRSTGLETLLPGVGSGCLSRLGGKLYLLTEDEGITLNGQPLRPRVVALSEGDRLAAAGGATAEVVSMAAGSPQPRLRQIATQSFAHQGRLLASTVDGAVYRIGLRGLLFQLLLLLLEAAVGSRLRGVIETQPGSDEMLEDDGDSLPRGAMRLHDLRLELVAERRLSLAATRALIAELQAALVAGGLDGPGLLVLGDRWACIVVDLDCAVDLYR